MPKADEKSLYSFPEGGYVLLDDTASGVVSGIGKPAGWNEISAWRSPLAEAVERGTAIMPDMFYDGMKFRLDSGSVTSPPLAFNPTAWNDGLYSLGANNIGVTINGTLVTDWNATRQRLNTTIALQFGDDVSLSRGAANRLDLATGDDFNIVLGSFQIGATTVFESDRDFAVNLIPNADAAFDLGSSTRRMDQVFVSRAFECRLSAGHANSDMLLGDNGAGERGLWFGAGAGSSPDVRLYRDTANVLSLADGDSFTVVNGSVTANKVNLLDSTNQIVLDSDVANTGTITMSALTAARVWTFPDATGTVPLGTGAADRVTYWSATNTLTAFGAMTNGQLIIGSTGATPVVASLTAGANITITPGAGSITIAATGGGGNTLDQSYDQGGAGAGRTITVDSGAVQLTGGGTTVGGFTVNGSRTIASAAGAVWNEILLDADVSLSGSTNVTTAAGFNMVTLNAPTITDAGTITSVTNAATLYISGAPTGSGLTITNAHALKVESGASYFNGAVTLNTTVDVVSTATFHFDVIINDASITQMFEADTINTGFSFGATSANGSLQHIVFTPPAAASGVVEGIIYTGAAHTGQTAGTEVIDIDWDLDATLQHASNTAVTTQRSFLIRNRTYSFASATGTITTAATVAILGAPVAGTNAAITNAYALWVQDGLFRIDANVNDDSFQIRVDNINATGGSGVRINRSSNIRAAQVQFSTSGTGDWYVGLIRDAGGATSKFAISSNSDLGSGGAQFIIDGSNIILNERAAAADFRVEGDTLAYMLFLNGSDAALENIAFLTTAEPNWQTMDGGMFVGNVITAPTGNPTSGGFMYSNAGAGTWRGSGGTITAFGPAGPHCGKCGADFWTVAALNENWGAYIYECGWCGERYKKGPKSFLDKLTAEQRAELIYN